jgi:hypothetical protein
LKSEAIMLFRCMSAALAATAFSFTAPATAQQPTASEPIVVVGRRAEEMAQSYAGEIAVASAAENQYARWSGELCPSVAGLPGADAQALIDHIARRAHAVGVETGRADCQRNLVIIFASDSDALAREIVDTRRDLMGYYTSEEVITGGREALEAFATTPRPVRWWHVAYTVSADGDRLGDTDTRVGRGTNDAVAAAQGMTGSAATAGNGFNGVEAVRSQGTRFRRSTRQDIGFVLIVVDTRRIAGSPTAAVADYLAMASLVQLDADADMGAFPSILNLFAEQAAGQAATTAMTEWDLGYLQGLYAATREAATARQQRSQIARRIVREIGGN